MNTIGDQSSVIEADQYTVRRTIDIAAPVESVWTAVTEPAHISAWFGDTVLEGTGVGATGTMSWPDHGSIPLRVEAMDAPHSVSYRWSNDDATGAYPEQLDEETSTVFTFTLEATDAGTRLTVVETGFDHTSDPAANMESHRTGWNLELDKLIALLESDS